MALLVLEPALEERLIAERQATGIDHHDEVWDGTYIMSPLANNEHQWLATRLASTFQIVLDALGGRRDRSFGGVNVSDQELDWTKNYRVPDVAVFMAGNPAEDRETHWFGGPDFAVEIVSPGDRSRLKLDFYAAVHVRELLIVERDPWLLELFRLHRGQLLSVGHSTTDRPDILASQVLPVNFRLLTGQDRPLIEVIHHDSRQTWSI